MNLCFLSYRGNMFCGGQGVYLYYLTRALAQRGHQITVIVGPPYPADMPWADVRREINHQFWGWHLDWLPKSNPFHIYQPLNFLEYMYRRVGFFPEPMGFSMRAFRTFGNIARKRRFDLVHDVQSLGFGLIPLTWSDIPVISTIHHPLTVDLRASMNQPGKTFTDVMGSIEFYPVLMQGFVARRLSAIVTSTEAGRDELVADFRIKPERIRIVGNGLDVEHFRPVPGIERDPNTILFVGYVDNPQKGFYYLLKALKLMPERVKLIAVDEAHRFWAPVWIKEIGVEDRVKFTGKLSDEDLLKCYSRAAVTVMPSLYEGFGLPAAEALCCGSAVVATRAGALPEIVLDGKTGLLVPPKDPEALAAAIMELLNNEPRRRKMTESGREHVSGRFGWDVIAEKTEAVYKELISSC